MSTNTCGECGTIVSTSVKTCPGCGAGARVVRRSANKKPMGRAGNWGLAAIVVVSVGVSATISPSAPSGSKSNVDLAYDARVQAAYIAVNTLKRALRDPDSASGAIWPGLSGSTSPAPDGAITNAIGLSEQTANVATCQSI